MSATVGPDTVPALLERLRAALAHGDEPLAEQCAAQILLAQPGDVAASAYLSMRARLRGDLGQALLLADAGLRREPRSALLLFNRGAALLEAGQLDAAASSLEDALRAQPELVWARFWLGSAQQRAGHVDASLCSRLQALDQAERQGLLDTVGSLPAEARRQLDAAIAAIHAARAGALAVALQPLRARHGDAALRRIDQALARHTGGVAPAPANALQEPSFLFIPGLPDAPWWERGAFEFLEALEAATDAIRAELLEVLADDDAGLTPYIDMPDSAPAAAMWRALNRSPRWSGYHLYRHGERVEAHCRRCPRTAEALAALPLLRIPGHGPEALFSVLRPGTHIPPHTGVINGRLTAHLPLLVPPDCGALAVARQPRPWQEGRCLVFDDSYVHEAWNQGAHTRVVLIFDLWNPALAPVEREALSLAIVALGAFNRRHGGADAMHESA